MLLLSLSLPRWSLGQQDPWQPTLGGDSSTRRVSEKQESRRPVWAAGCFVGLLREWQDVARLSLTKRTVGGASPEQHGFEHFPLTGGSLPGVSFEQEETTQASADVFLTDLVLSRASLRRRRQFCATWSLVAEPLLQQESSEVRRERADDFVEHCFPSSGCRSRILQQVSWPRAMRARQIHPKACRVAP